MKQMILTIDAYVALIVVLINFIFAILLAVRHFPKNHLHHLLPHLFCQYLLEFWRFHDLFYSSSVLVLPFLDRFGHAACPHVSLDIHVCEPSANMDPLGHTRLCLFRVPGLQFSSNLCSTFYREVLDSVIWNILYLILLGPFIVASIILLLRAMERAGSDG